MKRTAKFHLCGPFKRPAPAIFLAPLLFCWLATASASPELGGLIELPLIDVPVPGGGTQVYQAQLKVVSAAPLTVELLSVGAAAPGVAGVHASCCGSGDLRVSAPEFKVPDGGEIKSFHVDLVAVPGSEPMRFTVDNRTLNVETRANVSTAHSGTYQNQSHTLTLPAVQVGANRFDAQLALVAANPITFELLNTAPSISAGSDSAALFDPSAATVYAPHVYVDTTTPPLSLRVAFTLVPGSSPLRFEVSGITDLPYFSGITNWWQTGLDSVLITWNRISLVPPQSRAYEIYLGTTPDFTPSADTLYARVGDVDSYTIDGLAPGQTYYALVIAVDSAGKTSMERDYFAFVPTTIATNDTYIEGRTVQLSTARLDLAPRDLFDGMKFDPIEFTEYPVTEYPPYAGLLGQPLAIGPQGTDFQGIISLILPYDPAALPAGVAESSLILARLVNGEWNALPDATVDTVNHTVRTDIPATGVYAVVAPGFAGLNMPPRLASFQVSQQRFEANIPTPVVVSWTYANTPVPAPTCQVYPQGQAELGAPVVNGGSQTVTLSESGAYVLNCANRAGNHTLGSPMQVAARVPPQLSKFRVSPAIIAADSAVPVMFTWEYAQAPLDEPACTISGIGAMSNGGTARVTVPSLLPFMQYTLTCTNTLGTASKIFPVFGVAMSALSVPVDTYGGVFPLFGNLGLDIPPGALEEAVNISIQPNLNFTPTPNLIFMPFDLQPDGLSFSEPATLRIPYEQAILDALGIDPADIEIATWEGGAWRGLPTSADNGFLSAGLSHFSGKAAIDSNSCITKCDGAFCSNNDQAYGCPKKLPRSTLRDTLKIRFFVAGDPQLDFDGCSSWPTEARYTWNVVEKINASTQNNDMGIVVPGDFTHMSRAQDIVMFRQFFEHDYPGRDNMDRNGGAIACGRSDTDHTYYSSLDYKESSHRVTLPAYPGLGNHDATENDNAGDDKDGRVFTEGYLRARVSKSDALYKHPFNKDIESYQDKQGGLYAWEWGSFHLVMASFWPGAYEASRLDWLENHLKQAVGDSGKAVLLFQHYAWDSEWGNWNDDGEKRLLNVLCGKRQWDSNGPCNPYNVIGIFSGHTHEFSDRRILAGKNSAGNDVYFDNYVTNDAGAGYGGADDDAALGFLTVELTHDNMKLFKTTISRGGNVSENQMPWKTKSISTALMTWAQGEPNNANDNEDCAEFAANGRYNDINCDTPRRIACKSGAGDWMLASGEKAWKDGWNHCASLGSGYVFAVPNNVAEQRALMDKLAQAGVNQAWINQRPPRALWASNTGGKERAQLVVQPDSNVVIYDWYGEPAWASGTGGHPGAGDVMQDSDGNYVIYADPVNRTGPLWSTGTNGHPGAVRAMQNDGNLCIWRAPNESSNPLWCSGTGGNSDAIAVMQGDGNLVIAKRKAVWATNTSGKNLNAPYLLMQGDGNLVLKDANGTVAWASNTSGHSGAVASLQADGNLVVTDKERIGGCLSLPDSSGWAKAADSNSLDLSPRKYRYEPRSHEVWRAEMVFKAPQGTTGTWLFRKADGNKVNYGCRLNADRTISCVVQSTYPGGSALTTTTQVGSDRYHSLRLSLLGNKLQLFLDMRMEASLDIGDNGSNLPDYANNQPLFIGVNDQGQGGGSLRVNRFYIMRFINDMDVHAEWPLEIDGKDRSGYGNHLTLSGSAAVRQYVQQCQ